MARGRVGKWAVALSKVIETATSERPLRSKRPLGRFAQQPPDFSFMLSER
jgi:hypothetical protein